MYAFDCNMLFKSLGAFFLLPSALRSVSAQNSTTSSTSTACNNSPSLCDRAYNDITYLGAHDSPFVRDAATDFSTSGNQYYNSTSQLSAGVRLLTAQVQLSSNDNSLHVCHTSCLLLDAGPLSDWLGEVRSWMDSNPNEVVTILLVNEADASASDLAAAYQEAGITTSLAYTPSASTSGKQDWPTLKTLINRGARLLNFISSLSDNSGAPYLMNEFTFIFENPYDVTSPSDFSCEANRPSNVANNTQQALSDGMMPLMNHFLYNNSGLGIQIPDNTYVSTTNAPGGGIGNLGTAASRCKQTYGRAPTYILVDFFNVGPSISTVDRMNGVTAPVGRISVSTANTAETSAAGITLPKAWVISICLTAFLAFTML